MTAVLIGRFQTSFINQSIRDLVSKLKSSHSSLVIVLGVSKAGTTKDNPLDFPVRKDMFTEAFPDIPVYPIDDQPLDERWSKSLDDLIATKLSGYDVVIYGSEDGFIRRYSGTHKTIDTGTRIKSDLKSASESSSVGTREFREGIMHALSKMYPKVYPTVDIALFRSNRKELLLGMKGAEKKWRFMGGFTDPTDDNYEEAARRELKEECGITDVKALQYEGSFRVDDWRYRYEEDKIITMLFSAEYVSGNAVASDDIETVKWFSLADVKGLYDRNAVAVEHRPLFSFLLAKYGTA